MKSKKVAMRACQCAYGSCPAVYETDRGTCLIIGTELDPVEVMLGGKVGPDEAVVEIPVSLVRNIINRKEIET